MEGQCSYFVTRKKRLCRMTVRTGAKYCGEHEPKTLNVTIEEKEQDSGRLRMACPLDPKHTCYVSKLEKHLKVCNANQDTSFPYIKKSCNVSDDVNPDKDVEEDNDDRRSLANVSEDALAEVVAIIENIYDSLIADKVSSFKSSESHACVKQELENAERGDNTKRHLLQTSALISIVEAEKLVNENTCFVELGAGKGQVSFYLANVVKNVPGCSVLLVDRASHRHKLDNKLDSGSHRIRADISDLLISEVPIVSSSEKIVSVAKHLCGAATDLALRCITKSEIIEKTEGLVMATCCHHRCYWKSYVGKAFLEEQGVTYTQFNIISGLVSWATCGTGLSRERRAQMNQALQNDSKLPKKVKYTNSDTEVNEAVSLNSKNNLDSNNSDITIKTGFEYSHGTDLTRNVNDSLVNSDNDVKKVTGDNYKKPNEEFIDNLQSHNIGVKDENKLIHDVHVKCSKNLGLSLKQRAVIGVKAKHILDWGRMLYLRQHNYKARLCYYVDSSVSPENVCIIAIKNQETPL